MLRWWAVAPPASRAAFSMPERVKARPGSWHELSTTVTERGAGREALTDQLADQLGVGVGGLFGRAVPRAVGFDGDPFAGFHEGFDAAQRGKRMAEIGGRPFAAGVCQCARSVRIEPPVPWPGQRFHRWRLMTAGPVRKTEAEAGQRHARDRGWKPLTKHLSAPDLAVFVHDWEVFRRSCDVKCTAPDKC